MEGKRKKRQKTEQKTRLGRNRESKKQRGRVSPSHVKTPEISFNNPAAYNS